MGSLHELEELTVRIEMKLSRRISKKREQWSGLAAVIEFCRREPRGYMGGDVMLLASRA